MIVIYNENKQIDHVSNIMTSRSFKISASIFQNAGKTENVTEFEFERF